MIFTIWLQLCLVGTMRSLVSRYIENGVCSHQYDITTNINIATLFSMSVLILTTYNN